MAGTDGKAFGEHLASLRKAQKLSQEGLAKAADLSRGYLALIEQGRNKPSRKTVRALAAALAVDVNELLQAADYEPEDPRDLSPDDNDEAEEKLPRSTAVEAQTPPTEAGDEEAGDAAQVSPTLKWAYECIKRDPNFNYEERMGGQELPPGIWLGFIEMYQGLTGRVLLKSEEIEAFRNAGAPGEAGR